MIFKGFNHFKYDMKLSNKFKLSFLFVAFIPLVILSFVATYISSSYIEKAEKQNQFNQLKIVNSVIDFNYEMYIHKAEQIFSNEDLQNVIIKEYKGLVDLVEGYDFIDKYFQSITFDVNYTMYQYAKFKNLYDDIKIKIYTYNNTLKPDERYIFSMKQMENEKWIKDVFESDNVTWDITSDTEGGTILRFARKLVYFKDLRYIGVVSMEIPISLINHMIQKNRANTEEIFLYIDDTGSIIVDTSNQNEAVGRLVNDYVASSYGKMITVKLNDKSYVLYGIDSQITGWHLMSLLPLKYIKESSNQLRLYTLLVAFFVLIICLIMSQGLSNIIKKRLNRLINKIKKIENDHYSDINIIEGNDEIGQVDQVFISMIEKIKNLIEVEYKSQILRDSIKLDLLQEQINPHLLYNTLSAIGWHAKKSGNMQLFDNTNSLIRFYRISLNRGQVIIPFKQEIEMTLEYISLIEFTYKMNFEKDIQIDNQIYDYYTIKLILQPIVENALMHGLRNSDKAGNLKLQCYKNDCSIIIHIEDNGLGMSEETLSLLLNDDGHAEKGYGLTNIIKRLRLYYGEKQHIKIKSSLKQGTRVTIELPAMTEKAIKEYLETKFLL